MSAYLTQTSGMDFFDVALQKNNLFQQVHFGRFRIYSSRQENIKGPWAKEQLQPVDYAFDLLRRRSGDLELYWSNSTDGAVYSGKFGEDKLQDVGLRLKNGAGKKMIVLPDADENKVDILSSDYSNYLHYNGINMSVKAQNFAAVKDAQNKVHLFYLSYWLGRLYYQSLN